MFNVGDLVRFTDKAKTYKWYASDEFYRSGDVFIVSQVDYNKGDVYIKLHGDPSNINISDEYLEIADIQEVLYAEIKVGSLVRFKEQAKKSYGYYSNDFYSSKDVFTVDCINSEDYTVQLSGDPFSSWINMESFEIVNEESKVSDTAIKENTLVKFIEEAKESHWYKRSNFYSENSTFTVRRLHISGATVQLFDDPEDDWIHIRHLEVVTEPSNQAAKHKHYDLIVEWASAPDLFDVYALNPDTQKWAKSSLPHWSVEREYILVQKGSEIASVYSDLLGRDVHIVIDSNGKVTQLQT